GVRMRVEVHVLRLMECGLHRVVTGGVCAIHPVSRGGTRGGVEGGAFLRQLRISYAHARSFFCGLHVRVPTRHFYAAVADGARAICGAAPGKTDEWATNVEPCSEQRHNREQGTENDQDDLLFHLC